MRFYKQYTTTHFLFCKGDFLKIYIKIQHFSHFFNNRQISKIFLSVFCFYLSVLP